MRHFVERLAKAIHYAIFRDNAEQLTDVVMTLNIELHSDGGEARLLAQLKDEGDRDCLRTIARIVAVSEGERWDGRAARLTIREKHELQDSMLALYASITVLIDRERQRLRAVE